MSRSSNAASSVVLEPPRSGRRSSNAVNAVRAVRLRGRHPDQLAGVEVTQDTTAAPPVSAAQTLDTYFHSMGKVPRLTAEGEVCTARDMEEGERLIIESIARVPLACAELALIGRELARGKLRLQEVARNVDEEVEGEDSRTTVSTLLGKLAELGEKGDSSAQTQWSKTTSKTRRAAAQPELEEVVDALSRLKLQPRVVLRITRKLTMRAKAAPEDEARTFRRTIARIKRGRRVSDMAKARLIEGNLRLVVTYANRVRHHGMPLLDLIQEGNIGLMRAVDKFDYRRGYKFSTYASWWVKQAISRSISDQGSTIRIPVHMNESIQKVRRATRTFTLESGRTPTKEELASRTGISLEKVTLLDSVPSEPLSMNAPVGDEDGAYLGDFVADTTSPRTDELVAKSRWSDETRTLIGSLSVREQKILRMRFGIGEARDHTLEEIGESMSLTRERIRQIEKNALRKLRQMSLKRRLRSYLDEA